MDRPTIQRIEAQVGRGYFRRAPGFFWCYCIFNGAVGRAQQRYISAARGKWVIDPGRAMLFETFEEAQTWLDAHKDAPMTIEELEYLEVEGW